MAREVGGIIGKEITVRGEIDGREDLLVEGVVEGTVRLQAELIVGEGGVARVEADTAALTVEGRFEGAARCAEVVTLRAGSKTSGTIAAPRVVVDDEATFDGSIDMDVGLDAGEAGNA
jgi:cytoskeletal protein CcmA (bactofilin family)